VYLDQSPNLVHSTIPERPKSAGKPWHRLPEQTILGQTGMAPSKTGAATKCFETWDHHLG